MISRRNLLWLLAVGSLSLQGGIARADDDANDDDEDDHDRALDAVRNNHAASFKEIISIVEKRFEGEIIDVSVIGSGPDLVYRIKLLDGENRLIEVAIGAVSRKIISIKGI